MGRPAVRTVLRNVRFYLIRECEISRPPDFHPWNYAIYHCGTMSNVYSMVHWGASSRLAN
ncbi:MAG TPA: hypothetical protein PKO09_10755 [Anaerolineae bacterium]|nr:hypothetical protein [Anaerolineae bacterium]